MSNTAKESMGKIDALISRYAPVDLATSKVPDSAMCVDLRNIRHSAFSILCELNNLERRHESLASEMRQLMEFKELAGRVTEIYKYFLRDFEKKPVSDSTGGES